MFGTLRLFLASIVAVYHAGYHPFGLLIGASAVIVFYIISGYVISALYSTRFGRVRYIPAFYRDRCIRIYPQYLFYLSLTFVFFYYFSMLKPTFPYFKHVICNVTLMPFGLAIYSPMFSAPRMLPPTYSLANELLFYLLAPLLFNRIGGIIASILSLTVFVVASNGVINAEYYTYYYLPGPIIFFLIGHFIYRRQYMLLSSILLLLIGNHVHLLNKGHALQGLNNEIYIGIYAGALLVFLLSKFKQNKLDDKLGAWSYGCFLAHWPLEQLLLPHLQSWGVVYARLIYWGLAVFCGVVSYYWIEKPTIRLRRRLSVNKSLAKTMTHHPLVIDADEIVTLT